MLLVVGVVIHLERENKKVCKLLNLTYKSLRRGRKEHYKCATHTRSSHSNSKMSTDYFRHAFLRFESVRYLTFHNWSLQTVDRKELAHAGFYYSNSCFRVHCFSCGITLDMWQVQRSPLAYHYTINPYCPFLRGKDSSILALEAAPRPNAYTPIVAQGGQLEFSEPGATLEEPEMMVILDRLGSYNKKASGIKCFIELPARTDHTLDPVGFKLLMKKEAERLKTFALGGWPFEFSSPQSMAKNGFFHCLLGNVVQCAFCDMVVSPWTFDSDPKSLHENESANCPLLQGANCENVPIPSPPVPELDRNTSCLVCLESQRCVLFKPCDHFVCCSICAARQRTCPVCRVTLAAQLQVKLQ